MWATGTRCMAAAWAAAKISYRSPRTSTPSGRLRSNQAAKPSSARHTAWAVASGPVSPVRMGMRAAMGTPSASISFTVLPYSGARCAPVTSSATFRLSRRVRHWITGRSRPYSARVPVTIASVFFFVSIGPPSGCRPALRAAPRPGARPRPYAPPGTGYPPESGRQTGCLPWQ